MRGIFSYDGWFMQMLCKIADMIILSILWLVASLPVITVGAASAALYYTVHKVIRRGQSTVWRTYWHAFKLNFKQSSLLWVIIAVIDILMLTCCWYGYVLYLSQAITGIFLVFMVFFAALIVSWTCCLLPYASRFNNSIKEILKNCVVMLLLHIFPLVLLAPILVLCVLGAMFFPPFVFVAPAICSWLSGSILERVFRKHMSQAALSEDSL